MPGALTPTEIFNAYKNGADVGQSFSRQFDGRRAASESGKIRLSEYRNRPDGRREFGKL